jgi:hypothetical protein
LGYWINQTSNTTITTVASGAPDGGAFTRLVTTGSGAQGRIVQVLFDSDTSQTASFYVKGTGKTQINLFMSGGGNFTSPEITLTNSWQRISISGTRASGSSGDFQINTFGGNTLDVWGAQAENGSYMTSLIPTTTATVTRLADAASKTGISSLIGQTEGTLFFEGSASDLATFKRVAISSGSFSSSVYLDFRNDGSVVASSWASGGLVLYQPVTPSNPRNRNKYAIAYKSNDWAVYVNGTLAAAQSSGAATFSSTLNTLEFALGGNDPFTGNVNQVLLFKTRLTNAQLAELTTL